MQVATGQATVQKIETTLHFGQAGVVELKVNDIDQMQERGRVQ